LFLIPARNSANLGNTVLNGTQLSLSLPLPKPTKADMLAEIRDKQAWFGLYQDQRNARRARQNARRCLREGVRMQPADSKRRKDRVAG
jgi:hypothetical protein